jgi:hypothetical protein
MFAKVNQEMACGVLGGAVRLFCALAHLASRVKSS